MTTFAREKSLIVNDPQQNNSLQEYLLRYNAVAVYGWMSDGWVFKSVPDGTEHGATDNGDGTYTNPPPPPAPSQDSQG